MTQEELKKQYPWIRYFLSPETTSSIWSLSLKMEEGYRFYSTETKKFSITFDSCYTFGDEPYSDTFYFTFGIIKNTLYLIDRNLKTIKTNISLSRLIYQGDFVYQINEDLFFVNLKHCGIWPSNPKLLVRLRPFSFFRLTENEI